MTTVQDDRGGVGIGTLVCPRPAHSTVAVFDWATSCFVIPQMQQVWK